MPQTRPGLSLPVGLASVAVPAALGLGLFAATGSQRGSSLLPDVPFPTGNQFTEEKRVLGKILFYEEQLSADNTVSCATCHTQTSGGADARLARHPGLDGELFTDDDVFGSPGVINTDANGDYLAHPVFGLGVQVSRRAAPPVINAGHALEIFWDGRAPDVFVDPDTGEVDLIGFAAFESQAVNPPLDAGEMAHHGRSWPQVTEKLAHARPLALTADVPPDMADAVLDAKTYPELFRRAFGDTQITAARIAKAIATYERTLVADQSPWDDYINGDTEAISAAAKRGWDAFDAVRCTVCHVPPLFTDQSFRNIGVRPIVEDRGRQNVTGQHADRGKFKTPGLRNLALRSTFMHNGGFHSLAEVVDFYASNNKFPENMDGFANVNLNAQQRADMTVFLEETLTDPRVAAGVFPFDSPRLHSDAANDPNPFVLTGTARPGPTGQTPEVIAVTPPLIGADDFKLGVTGVPEGAQATLVISASPPVDGQVPADQVLGPFTATHPDGLAPAATAHWPIPFAPALDGQVRYMQWRVEVPGSDEPALSDAVRVTLFCGFGDCATGCLADLNRDQSVDLTDLLAFIDAYAALDPAADLAAPAGEFDVFDLLAYLDAYNRGCP